MVIAARNLSKRYGPVQAVDKIDLTVRRGEIYGFLGRNGAGKTTTIRMFLGLIRPTEGEVVLLEETIRPGVRKVFSRVGYLVETATAYPNLTVRENLAIQRRLMGQPQTAVDAIIAQLGLAEYANRRAGHLSLGNKQRLALARAMIAQPELLILDEPANGLDPGGIVEVRALLRGLADEQGVTIFLSSHILGEIGQLADRIGIIHNGRIIEDMPVAQLHARTRRTLLVGVTEPERAADLLAARFEFAHMPHATDGLLRIPARPEQAPEIARLLVDAGLNLTRLCPEEESLEAYFMRITEEASCSKPS
ncbi:MAG: ABC transporter ATP-binding protein [Caldilineaceae bacterium]|nr:ABC transporter ATP-binding protein [Caldilineaceae bacterium]